MRRSKHSLLSPCAVYGRHLSPGRVNLTPGTARQSLLLPHRFTSEGRAEAVQAARTVAVPDAFGTLGTASKVPPE